MVAKFLLFCVLFGCSQVNADIYKHPICNNLRFRAGCLLDGLEKACESVKDLSRCVDKPATCKEADEFPVTPEVFTEDFSITAMGREGNPVEGVWKCCCPPPDGKTKFSPYNPGCSDPDPACMAILQEKVYPVSRPHQASFKSCLGEGKQCSHALEGVRQLSVAVQEARAELMKTESPECRTMPNSLAPPALPASKCGDVLEPAWSRPIERPDIYCDTISWQFWEMGSSDAFKSQCPNHPLLSSPWIREAEEQDGADAAAEEAPGEGTPPQMEPEEEEEGESDGSDGDANAEKQDL